MKAKVKVATEALSRLPRQHRIALLTTSCLMAAVILWQPAGVHVDHSSVSGRKDILLPLDDIEVLSEQNSEPLGAVIDPQDPEFQVEKDELEQQLDEVVETAHSHNVASGDNLGSIFNQYALPIADMYKMIGVNKAIERLGVGQSLTWTLNDDGQVSEFAIKRNAKETDRYTLVGKQYRFQTIEEKGEIKPVFLTGRISGSFYNSALAAGLSPNQIQTLVQAMQWRFDLGRESQKGDRFAVTVDREFIDGTAVNRGDIRSLYYLSGNREVFVMRHSDGQFYDVEGHSLNRALRRFPLAKRYRISSSFNPNRKHPVTGRISPHNGTDFATPVGTPVLASGDGVVVKAQKHPLAGNFVVIKHGREYMTRYLHLHRILVKVGDKVTMGQRIALSGNTGRSTGPHLHYELIKKNRPVNAMKVPLPQAAPVPSAERKQFLQQARQERDKLKEVVPG
ncbi:MULTISPECIES: murein DD-endopeptidase MepM [Photobacterium]|uniref:Peptigoglycan-binding protein LysM n=1 Tax=Photobacterium ganghwense TaxID=320778 RepID=A0A0J1HI33_9GAMM|nr:MULTISPECIES: murein DD-endopeptidase MepM [Photobacterium]KLV11268.1 peptigoglycan-binding protein LysM [Photobacterium ganghwense]MBV1842438.1 murein DD-endopeptidase MepM [Photobacterium ganghwense]PSU08109.1 murein DD-endopeptidase MepM [Photobacterium ganghwense]QSV14918.1 murein DD-endopeptidase MepM [Photobacterium ganghwense]